MGIRRTKFPKSDFFPGHGQMSVKSPKKSVNSPNFYLLRINPNSLFLAFGKYLEVKISDFDDFELQK